MKESVILLLGTILVVLLGSSVETVNGDHDEPGIGIFENEIDVNTVPTKDSKYMVHLQVEVRNAQNQLISVSETTHVNYIPNEITDNIFNEKLGKKEIIVLDDIKYEKIRYTALLDTKQLLDDKPLPHFIGLWYVNWCDVFSNHGYTCVPIFLANSSSTSLEENDIVRNSWVILREIN